MIAVKLHSKEPIGTVSGQTGQEGIGGASPHVCQLSFTMGVGNADKLQACRCGQLDVQRGFFGSSGLTFPSSRQII